MPRPLQRNAQLSAEYAPVSAAIADARTRLADWIANWTEDEDTMSDLILVLSELLANAVAASPSHAPVHVEAVHDDGTIVLEVSNVAAAPSVADPVDLEDPLRGSGRGLLIVKSLVDDVHVESRDGRTVLRCRYAVGGPATDH